DLLCQLLEPGRCVRKNPLQLRVIPILLEKLARALEIVLEREPFPRQLVRGLDLAVLPPDLSRPLAVGVQRRVGHLPLQLREAVLYLVDKLIDHALDCRAPTGTAVL